MALPPAPSITGARSSTLSICTEAAQQLPLICSSFIWQLSQMSNTLVSCCPIRVGVNETEMEKSSPCATSRKVGVIVKGPDLTGDTGSRSLDSHLALSMMMNRPTPPLLIALKSTLRLAPKKQ
eukprot:2631958-Pleurochrysis_carterae.AAC.1